MILEEFDYDKDAILNPAHFMESQIVTKGLRGRMPKVGVSCFERKGFNRILELLDCKEIAVNLKYILEFTAILDEVNVGYRIGKTWTTDAIYRETRAKMERRKEMGCICVEMECSAMAAVAKFRDKEFFQFLFAADNLDAKEWDRRSLGDEVKFEEKDMFAQLAMELAVRIS